MRYVVKFTRFKRADIRSLRARLSITVAMPDMPKQYGAIPFRIHKNKLEVMLVTSSQKRWLVPKGHLMRGDPRYTARREAFEESGVRGRVRRKALGSVKYRKKKKKRTVKVDLKLYPLAVTRQAKNFPERRKRRTRWFPLKEAIDRCSDPALSRLLGKLKDAVS
jgi:uncharacterized protein